MDESSRANQRIDKYLDDVSLQLRYMSPSEAVETRDELRQHIYALVAELRAGGASEKDAVAGALKKFGPANRVGFQLGSKSMQEFLSGLETTHPAGNEWRSRWQPLFISVCFGSASVIFSSADRILYWPYLIALIGGSIFGVMVGFDKDRVILNVAMYRELRIRATYSEQEPRRRSLSAFVSHSLNEAMVRSLDRRFEMEQLGATYNPLTELDWKFYCRTAACFMVLLLIPDGLHHPLIPHAFRFLKSMLLWMTLWSAVVDVSSVVIRVARRKFAARV